MGYPERFAITIAATRNRWLVKCFVSCGKRSDDASGRSPIAHHRWKNSGIRPPEAGDSARTDAEHVAASGYRRYQQAIKLAAQSTLMICYW